MPDGTSTFYFQNFHIKADAVYQSDRYSFLPFGFSGVTTDRDGGNVEATLAFPNNEVARAFANEAIHNEWLAIVRVCIIDRSRIDEPEVSPTLLYRYVGQVSAGGWSDTMVRFVLSTVLDAVGTDIPQRTIHQQLVGNLPITGAIAF